MGRLTPRRPAAAALDRLLADGALRQTLAAAAYDRFRGEFTTERMLQRTADWFVRCGQSARPGS